jgi:uncharacterized membrane protein YjgN (DUF898 family)
VGSVSVAVASPPVRPAVASGPLRLVFRGRAGSLLGIHVVNVFLTLLTFGVYSFWAKIRVRRYLFAQTELAGDRFAFHGRGVEVLVGFVKAVIVFGLPLAALQYVPHLIDAGPAMTVAASIAAYALVSVIIPVARTGARRYRLSRSSWRGIRFSFRGRTIAFVRVYVVGALLTVLTLGLYYPIFATRNHSFLVRHSHFGNARFNFNGHGAELLADFVFALLLTLPTLGFVWFWYLARQRVYFWSHTTLLAGRFRATITGFSLFRLLLGNLFVIVLTLGLGWPWATVRTMRFWCRNLSLEGAVDLAAIQQEAQPASATGEGLLGLLEADLDIG